MQDIDPRLIALLRDRMGVPSPLVREAIRVHQSSGRPLIGVLIEMGLATPEQLSALSGAPAAPRLFPPLPGRVQARPQPSAPPLPVDLPFDAAEFEQGGSRAPVLLADDVIDEEGSEEMMLPGGAASTPLPAVVPAPPPVVVPLKPTGTPPERVHGLHSEEARLEDEHARARSQRRRDVLPTLDPGPERYVLGDEIARGGMGRVISTHDRNLDRTVATKLLIQGPKEQLGIQLRFIEEAQITGQLQHPNIVPVHDLGKTADDALYFTMKRVNGRTLRDILRKLRRNDPETVRTFTRSRLLNALKQVCLGVAYAHARGVVHRDLKPSNIMFGDFGEVLLMDWGLAKILDRDLPEKITSHRVGKQRWATRHGEVIGTPGYMPPELALGQVDDVDERADIYGLGAILYELLTLRPTYTGRDARTILRKMLREPLVPPRERAPERDIPVDIEAICMRCLHKNLDQRYASALELHDAIEAFLEGALARQRQQADAERVVEIARGHAEQHRALRRRVQRLQTELAVHRLKLPPWAGVDRRRDLWIDEQAFDAARQDRTQAFTRAEQAYRQALQSAPNHAEARAGLSELYWDAFLRAESESDQMGLQHFSALLRDVGDGRYDDLLRGDGRLVLNTDPPGVRAVLFRLEPIDRVATPVGPRDLGVTPVTLDPLPMGDYLMVLRAPGLREAQVPIHVGRLAELELDIRLYSDAHLGRGFVYIPGGNFRIGGDAKASWPLPDRTVPLPGFCIARLPVSCRQYLDFLNDLPDRKEARQRRPRLFFDGSWLFDVDPISGLVHLPATDQSGRRWDANWPVFGVSVADAQAYCAWRGTKENVAYRLPTEEEWEVAARGADGRCFVWGDEWEPTYSNNAHSRAGAPSLEPCGTYPTDRSPYGVLDLAGGVADWTSSRLPNSDEHLIRGGSWNQLDLRARAASRQALPGHSVAVHVGFRLARDP